MVRRCLLVIVVMCTALSTGAAAASAAAAHAGVRTSDNLSHARATGTGAGQIACVIGTTPAHVWLVRTNGSRLRRLTHAAPGHFPDYYQSSPAWAPGGGRLTYIDFAGVTNDTGCRLWVVNADGTGAQRLLPDGVLGDPESIADVGAGPAWSRDGSRIAFVNIMNIQGDPKYAWFGLFVYNLKTGKATLAYREPAHLVIESLVWSADGKRLEFSVDNTWYADQHPGSVKLVSSLRSLNLATRRITMLATAPRGTIFTGLDRSPNGRTLAVSVSPETSGRAELLTGPMGAAPRHVVVRAAQPTTHYLVPSWSPDGTRIAYGAQTANGASVWIVGAHGQGDHKVLANAAAPAWRPVRSVSAAKLLSGSQPRSARRVKVTLSVRVLPAQMGFDGEPQPTYPSQVTVRLPRAWSGKVAAYGAGGMVLLAARDWKEGVAEVGVDGSVLVRLHAAASAAVKGSLTYTGDGVDVGGSWFDAGAYFPWIRAHWTSSGYGMLPKPKALAGLRTHFIGKRLIAFTVKAKSASWRIHGVAHTSLMPGKQTYPLFDRFELKSQPKYVGLATAVLKCFVARYHSRP